MQDFEDLLEQCRKDGIEVRSDSRQVGKGDIFVAVPGVNEDGARFIPAAVDAGAAVVVCRPGGAEAAAVGAADCRVLLHPDPREALWRLAAARWQTEQPGLRILGITGTNGKTTSTYLFEHLFRAAGQKVGVLGTVSYRWPGHCEAAPLTTPDPLSVHAMLAQMRFRSVMGKPSSRMKPQLRYFGTAPLVATSFTVPHTAKRPMSPPGKNCGVTTKLSVE